MNDLATLPCYHVVNIVAVVYNVETPQTFNCRDQVTRSRQKATLDDDSSAALQLSQWQDHVKQLYEAEGQVLAVQNM